MATTVYQPDDHRNDLPFTDTAVTYIFTGPGDTTRRPRRPNIPRIPPEDIPPMPEKQDDKPNDPPGNS